MNDAAKEVMRAKVGAGSVMDDKPRKAPSLAFVIPCYNEEVMIEALSRSLKTLSKELVDGGYIRGAARILLVDDGSSDGTWQLIADLARDDKVTGLKLSRNFGHQAALLAGMLCAEDEILVSLDADLQDDLAAIPKMIDAYKDGAEIVFGVRSDRSSDTAFKRVSAHAYYSLLRGMGVDIIPEHADFRLMSRKAVETLRDHQEVNLFLRGLVSTLGYRCERVSYARNERFAGETKYSLGKMIKLAVEGITSFSVQPLRMVTWFGIIIALFSFAYGSYAIVMRLLGATVSGWASIVVSIYLLGGIQMIALGIIGEYLGRTYLETKRRPPFIIDQVV